MTRPYDLLIFDWDGTLADSAQIIVSSMQQAIGALSLPPRSDEQIRVLIGLGLNEALTALYPELALQDLLRLLDGYRQRFLATGVKEAPLFPGAGETLAALGGAGYRLAIATGKSRRGLERSLQEHAALRVLISCSRCADETASKPDPRMLRELLELEGVAPDRALMIGDTDYDMSMARALSMHGLGVACGVHDRERLLAGGAAGLIESVRELPDWLRLRQGTAQPA